MMNRIKSFIGPVAFHLSYQKKKYVGEVNDYKFMNQSMKIQHPFNLNLIVNLIDLPINVNV